MLMGCIAIWKPKGVQIAKKYLHNCYTNNPQGAGFAICRDNKIEIQKGFFKFKDFWKAFKGLQKFPALIHFRIATHGAVNAENCHPFPMLDGKFAMIHNGILPVDLPEGKDQSDSAYFAKNILEPFIEKVPWQHEPLTKFVGKSIGTGNKIIVMRSDSKAWIFNEKQGEWHNGAWYSNTGYKSCRSYSSYNHSSWYGGYNNCYNSRCDAAYWDRLEDKEGKEITPTDEELAILQGDNEFAPETKKEKDVETWLERKRRDASVIVSASEGNTGVIDVEFDGKTQKWSKKNPKVIKATRSVNRETYNQKAAREAAAMKIASETANRMVTKTSDGYGHLIKSPIII
jgi:hypothetical protein